MARVWTKYSWVGLAALAWMGCGTEPEPELPEPVEDMRPAPGQDMTPKLDMGPDASADDPEEMGPPAEPDMPPEATDMPPAMDLGELEPPESYPVTECDPLMTAHCNYPWPSNLYLAPDEERATGYTLTFGEISLPRGRGSGHIDPAPYRRLDGYGLGATGHVYFEDLDISQMATEQSIERSVTEGSPIVWLSIDGDGQIERVPHFVEFDALSTGGAQAALFIRPAVILAEDARQIIAMRGLTRTSGEAIEPSEAFAALRDGRTRQDPALRWRQARFDEIFETLEAQGITREELTLAWDFHTASSESLHGRMLHMRDDAFAQYADDEGPTLTVDEVEEFAAAEDGSGREVHEHIAFQIEGTFEVPLYMQGPGPGPAEALFNLGEDGLPEQNGTRQAKFFARIPHTALDGTPHGVITYGHGLLGSRYEIYADHIERLAHDYQYVVIAADLIGMSAEDADSAQAAVFDLSEFPRIADRLHQGLLEYLLLSRAGTTTLPQLEEMTSRGVVLDPAHSYFFGGSQGGIFGATYMALSTEVPRGFLAVPGNNYAVMLQRSTNFADLQGGLDLIYRDSLDRPLIISLLQLLWDGTDPVSYLSHITQDPLPGTPTNDALLVAAKGDYQVPVLTNEIAARSEIGFPIIGTYDAERTPWGVPQVDYPHTGSGLILWDFGNPWPAGRANRPPDDGLGDPHSLLSEVDAVGPMFDTYLRTGQIVDVCQGPCQDLREP